MSDTLVAAALILGGWVAFGLPLVIIEHRDATGRAPWDKP